MYDDYDTIVMEEDFNHLELKLIRDLAEYALDRGWYDGEDEEDNLKSLISVLRKLKSNMVSHEEDEE